MPSAVAVLAFLVLVLAGPVESTYLNQTEEVTMDSKIPKLKFHLVKLNVPTLETICGALAKSTRNKIYEYSIRFSSTLMRHFSGETEVQIVDAELTPGSKTLLVNLEADMEVLQYRKRLGNILQPWQQKLCGQPLNPEIQRMLPDNVRDIVEDFEKFILDIQTLAIKTRRATDDTLCSRVCHSNTRIRNLSEATIPVELERLLANVTNFVPLDVKNIKELKDSIEKDLILAAIRFFRDEN